MPVEQRQESEKLTVCLKGQSKRRKRNTSKDVNTLQNVQKKYVSRAGEGFNKIMTLALENNSVRAQVVVIKIVYIRKNHCCLFQNRNNTF